MLISLEQDYALISLPNLIEVNLIFLHMSSKEDKNKIYEKTNRDFSNTINETTNRDFNNTVNQQQDAINKTLDNTLNNIKRSTDEATREIPRYSQRIAEYQEKTVQTVKDIASDVIEAQKQVVNSFQSQVDRSGVWDWYNPQRIAENNAIIVNSFTNYLLNSSNLINNALESNIRVYNTALEQTRDNLKTWTKTNTDFIKSVNRQSSDFNRDGQRTTRF